MHNQNIFITNTSLKLVKISAIDEGNLIFNFLPESHHREQEMNRHEFEPFCKLYLLTIFLHSIKRLIISTDVFSAYKAGMTLRRAMHHAVGNDDLCTVCNAFCIVRNEKVYSDHQLSHSCSSPYQLYSVCSTHRAHLFTIDWILRFMEYKSYTTATNHSNSILCRNR